MEQVAADLGVELVSLEELFARADYVSLHMPSNDKTRNLINAERLARPKFHWARPFNAYHVSVELRAASAFLRSSARIGDTFATSLPATG